jgi:hypothetical protein
MVSRPSIPIEPVGNRESPGPAAELPSRAASTSRCFSVEDGQRVFQAGAATYPVGRQHRLRRAHLGRRLCGGPRHSLRRGSHALDQVQDALGAKDLGSAHERSPRSQECRRRRPAGARSRRNQSDVDRLGSLDPRLARPRSAAAWAGRRPRICPAADCSRYDRLRHPPPAEEVWRGAA